MPDDKTKRGPQDRAKTNVQEKYEMDYWSRKFGVTPDQLRNAVKKAGPSAAAVEREQSNVTTFDCLIGAITKIISP